MSKILDRAALLALAALPPKMEEVDVPELGGIVRVREMSGSQRDRFEEVHATQKYRNFRARYCLATLCDEAGEPLFSEGDVDALGRLPITALDRIYAAASRVNSLKAEDAKALDAAKAPEARLLTAP